MVTSVVLRMSGGDESGDVKSGDEDDNGGEDECR